MVTSYAANVVPYFDAMKKADPAANTGVPWRSVEGRPRGRLSRTLS
jgi:hypothetical protein